MLETFHQLGGSRNMRLNPSDIAVKLDHDATFDQELYAGPTMNNPLFSASAKDSPK
jgi:hypothetical protein